jgi:hypothetical protein
MTKTELWNEVQSLLVTHKAKAALISSLEALLAPKQGGSTIINPPRLNEDGEIVEVYCQWHKQYEPVEDFATSSKSKTGVHYECKVASKEWQKYAKEIKTKEDEIKGLLNKILDGEIEQADAKVISETLKAEIASLNEARANKIDLDVYLNIPVS